MRRLENNAVIEMQLDAPPRLLEECKPIEASADGSLFLASSFRDDHRR